MDDGGQKSVRGGLIWNLKKCGMTNELCFCLELLGVVVHFNAFLMTLNDLKWLFARKRHFIIFLSVVMVTIILFMNHILWRHDMQAVNYKTEKPVFEFRVVLISSIDFLKKFTYPPSQTPTQMLKSGFSMFSTQEIGSRLVSFQIIFEALQSERLHRCWWRMLETKCVGDKI